MTFPNGYEGVKKLFTSEILNIISAVCLLFSGIASIIFIASLAADASDATIGGGVATVVLMVAGGVLAIIGYILKLIGLKRAGKDEPMMDKAFWFALFALILSVVSSILGSANVAGGIADNIVNLFVNLAEIFIVVLVIGGIRNMAEQLGKEDMVNRGGSLLTIIIIMYVVAMVAGIVPVFFGVNSATASVSGILSVVSLVFNIIAYIVFLIYLGSAKKMLKSN